MAATWSTQSATRECQMAANGELTVVERMATLLETGLFADVTIRCGSGNDTATFKAHRLLLATAIPSLQKLMSRSNGENSILNLQDVQPDAFQHLLKYIYTDNVQINGVSDAFSLLRMSKNWCLNKLTDRTLKYLESFLETYEPSSEARKNELCDLILLTEDYLEDLNKKCWETLIQNVNKVVPCQGFLNMTQGQVRKLLSHEDFDYKNHLVLFEAIRDWGMNQVLLRHLKVNQLQDVIGSLMEFVNFKSIKDGDFMNTILPSDCLNKGDLIAFFITRGLEIPRDLAFSSSEDLEADKNFEKTRRFKRGYKLPDKEIYKEHELRFRVDKHLKLLGVGFGFLFSNTDMGITVHCQGPWEKRQWCDIMQTYCRVTWEKMKTADVRLMFSEAVNIEPNQSYKILVRVSRMTAGAGSVDLWGGSQGTPKLKVENAEFCFLKAAVDPNEEVTDEHKDNTPGMITDLFYQLGDGGETLTMNGDVSSLNRQRSVSRELTPPKPLAVHRSQRKPETPKPKKLNTDKIEALLSSSGTDETCSPATSPIPKNYGYVRRLSSSLEENKPPPTVTVNLNQPSWVKRKLEANPFTAKRTVPSSPSSLTDRGHPFLRSRQSSTERSKPSWQIPSRSTTDSTATSDGLRTRESSTSREQPQSKYSSTISRYGRYGSTTDSTPSSRYGSSLSTSRYGSRYGGSSTTSDTASTGSKYGSSTTSDTASTGSKYGSSNPTSDSIGSKYSSKSDSTGGSRYGSRYGTSNGSSDSSTTSRYGSSINNSSDSTSKYGTKSSETSEPTSRYGSRYGLSSRLGTSDYGSSSRYGSSSTSATTPTQNGTDSSSTSNKGSDSSSSRTYRPSYTSGLSSSRYGSGSSTTTSPASKARDPTPTRQSSSSLSRFGTTTSSLGSSYSSRFGSSYYRR